MTESSNANIASSKTLLICAGIVLLTVLVAWLIFQTEPAPEKEAASKVTPMLVETLELVRSDYRPVIKAVGTVIPAREVNLTSQVAGEVLELGESFVPGRIVAKNELLVRIDERDYRNALANAQAELTQAQTDLRIEMGEQELARNELSRLGKSLNEMQTELVLRKPQLAAAQAHVQSAKASLAQAELDLERTTIAAPFNGQVINRMVSEGSLVQVGADLGRFVGVDSFWVETSLPVSRLSALENLEQAKDALVVVHAGVDEGRHRREARIHSIVGAVDEASRLARVLIELSDPLALQNDNSDKRPIYLGEFVTCDIQARELVNVVRIPRAYVRKNNTVWLMQNEVLVIQQVQPIFRDEQFIYVREDLNDGDHVVVTDLARVRDGAPLRLAQEVARE